MKLLYTASLLIIVFTKVSAQDMIYFTGGTTTPGKITEITAEKVKFKNLANPTGPIYSRNLSGVQVAFNSAGDYLVFAGAKTSSDQERNDFINASTKSRSVDIVVDANGSVMPVTVLDENETEIVVNRDGKDAILSKKNLAYLIKKNGTHQIFLTPEQAIPYLSIDKPKINELQKNSLASKNPNKAAAQKTKTEPTTTTAISKSQPAENVPAKNTESPIQQKVTIAHDENELVVPDMAVFGSKALEKTAEFGRYLQNITSVSTNREAATKSINMACGLFLNEDARVEVSNLRTGGKNKYKIRDYLNRLLIKSGQYDKVQIEYANINYASKFKKGPDGNYYGSVTFVQKFEGFVDGNLVYADKTKRNMTIVLKHYEKAVNGENVSGWDVYLDDIGVVETRKI